MVSIRGNQSKSNHRMDTALYFRQILSPETGTCDHDTLKENKNKRLSSFGRNELEVAKPIKVSQGIMASNQ